ncbi:ExbD/TolR family protein [Wenzhouxiangella marina]|uniref:Biopolymer transporter n=1 Tax=Wenzhouxiangella marina TaxID=1579979 RepID=A0A0K0XX35_9GAMM|nr:biopolymer transporter ExbD [Wenzhouxiangella marina]AKS42191.1 Biopolymer transporter [Wenzhouxiangella marina]MBB6086037.1 biopolymer transport protein ExbD [Wenzhouxiangella marina]
MKLYDEEREEPEINLTSLIDVVFLLLIFFMVSTTFERQSLISLQLPEASTAQSENLPRLIELVVTDDGRLFIDEEQLADDRRATIQAAIAAAFEREPEATLVIRADAEAAHRLVVRAMDAAAAEGIERLTIAAVDESGPDS